MSVIAVKVTKDEIVMGADSAFSQGLTTIPVPNAKMFIHGPYTVGVVGTGSFLSVIKLFLEDDEHSSIKSENDMMRFLIRLRDYTKSISYSNGGDTSEHDEDDEYDENGFSFLLSTGSKVFFCENFMSLEINDYYAIGCGSDFAVAALELGHTVEEAVRVACHFSTYCSEPVRTLVEPR